MNQLMLLGQQQLHKVCTKLHYSIQIIYYKEEQCCISCYKGPIYLVFYVDIFYSGNISLYPLCAILPFAHFLSPFHIRNFPSTLFTISLFQLNTPLSFSLLPPINSSILQKQQIFSFLYCAAPKLNGIPAQACHFVLPVLLKFWITIIFIWEAFSAVDIKT